MRLRDARPSIWLMLLALHLSFVNTIPTQSTESNNGLSTLSLLEPPKPTFANAPDVIPRTNDFMSHLKFGWIYRLTQYDAYLPMRTAATTLASFYRDAIYNAEHVWPHAPPASEVKITQGAITLTMSCKRRTIPWSMVKSIAEDFLQGTQEGIGGRFEGRFVWVATGVVIWVSLKVNALMTV